ncbi:hypothetical protein VEE57_45400 (plasmid) [Escherichia coli]|nr:hypothetical protein VEE57_45400 [Escherichia coli]
MALAHKAQGYDGRYCIVAAAVSKLGSRRVLKPGEVPRTKITAAEYAETFEVDMDTAYDQLQGAAKAALQPLGSRSTSQPYKAQRQAAAADAECKCAGWGR